MVLNLLQLLLKYILQYINALKKSYHSIKIFNNFVIIFNLYMLIIAIQNYKSKNYLELWNLIRKI